MNAPTPTHCTVCDGLAMSYCRCTLPLPLAVLSLEDRCTPVPLGQRDTVPLSPVSRYSTFCPVPLVSGSWWASGATTPRLPLFGVQPERTPCCACGWRGVALAHMAATWAIVAMLAAYALGVL